MWSSLFQPLPWLFHQPFTAALTALRGPQITWITLDPHQSQVHHVEIEKTTARGRGSCFLKEWNSIDADKIIYLFIYIQRVYIVLHTFAARTDV